MTTSHLIRAITFSALAAVPATVAAQPASAAVDKAIAAWKTVRSSSGTVEQTVTNSLLSRSAVSHARFHQERPNRLAVRYTDLKGDAIVSDGKFVWLYFPASQPGQVVRRPASDQGTVPVDLSRFLDNPRARYDFADKGREKIGDRMTQAVLLTPKPGAPEWALKTTVWIDEADGAVRQFEIVENASITRRIRFQTLVWNGPIEKDAFVFVVPKGVKVVDQK